MGGILTWVLREASGDTHVMRRFTNPMPALVRTPAFYRGEHEGVMAALQPWLNFKADWEAHLDGGAFEYNSTRYLHPYPAPLASHDYGLLITDFVTRTFLSANAYARIDRAADPTLAYGSDPATDEVKAIVALREADLVSHHMVRKPGASFANTARIALPGAHLDETGALIFPKSIAYESLMEFCSTHRRRFTDITRMSAVIDVPGLTIKDFGGPLDLKTMKPYLDELGFDLTKADLQAWRDDEEITTDAE